MLVKLAGALLAASWPLFAAIPSPHSHFGHEMGADHAVLDWHQVVSYFKLLAAHSNRLRLEELGKTTEGRPFIAAIISSPETLGQLDRYIEIQRRLADPRITPEAEAEPMFGRGKTVVMVTCSIHSTETASTHTAVEFAHRLLTEDKPRFRAILENTILILVPSLNPDGIDIVTGWYRKTVGTPYEGTSPPQLYHKYVGHDNNRDWYIFSQVETRLTVSKLHNVWHPQIVYDLHQQGPYASRMFVPPWLDPIEPNVDAILMQECNMIGTAIAADLTAAGKAGVAINASYDFWTPARHYQAYHGGLRILTESASVRIASPVTIKPEQLETNSLGYNPRERSWNHLEPWPGGEWRLRDIVDYQLIAMESCLYQAAIRKEELLQNAYRVARRQISRTEPWAFVIPATQRDPGATRKLLETLALGMVEIEHTPGGAHVIRMAQPYSGFAKALLERQRYPDLRMYPEGPPRRPYDVTAHTLPLLMGVEVQTAKEPIPDLRPGIVPHWPSSLTASDTNTWRAINRMWKKGDSVWRNISTGDFSQSSQGPGWKQIRRPRIGLYQSFVPSIDEGWTRWLLEQFEFEYATLRDPDIRSADLRKRIDVLIFPDQPASVLERGYRSGAMPEEFTGGLGVKGAESLREFAASGGNLVFLNRAGEYALEHLQVKARNVVHDLANQDFYAPGSLLNVKVDAPHPLTLGLPADITIWSEQSPAWETDEAAPIRYPDSQILASGWLLGEKFLARRTALVDARVGDGHVILFGLRPQYRGQSYQTFKLFFNSLIYSDSATTGQ